MEVDSIWTNLTTDDYYTVNVTGNLSDTLFTKHFNDSSKKNIPSECGLEIKDGLFEFIISGILINLVSLFGILGNGISMVVLSRPQMKSSINYLLIGLARCDMLLIILSILLHGIPGIYAYTGYFFDYKFFVYPKIVRYLYPLSTTAQLATVYLTLIVTMERYVAVCHPLKARSFCTYGRARLAVIVIAIASFLYNLVKFWEVDLSAEVHWKYNMTVYCIMPTPLRDNRWYIAIYVHWMYLFVYYALPFVALVIFNVAIYKRVRKANKDLQQLTRHQRREMGLAMMLICVVIVFIICNVLPLVSNMYEIIYMNPPTWMIHMGNLLVTINSSINFIIYVIFGRKFKRLFLKLFCSTKLFGPGRESPEFQTNDESIVTNTTNIELRHSIKRSNHLSLHRSNTMTNRSSETRLSNGQFNCSMKQNTKNSGKSTSPVSCVYYPRSSPPTSPNLHESRTCGALNGWHNSDTLNSALQ